MTKAIMLVDGNALVHRAFHAVPPLTTSKGELVNAVYGFASMLLKVAAEVRPQYAAVAFDRAAPTFRHQEYEQYKAQRVRTDEGLYPQFARVHQLVDVLGIPAFEMDGYEADDVLGTLSRQAAEISLPAIIVTGDNDALQLVGPLVTVITPRRGFSETLTYDEQAVRERFGLSPSQLPDFKALVGDQSDNIPGVSGIGEKTAQKLISQFGSLEGLFVHLDELDPKLRARLEGQREQAFHSLHLVTIVRDVPIQLDLETCRFGAYDRSRAMSLLRELEFRSLVGKLPATSDPVTPTNFSAPELIAVTSASQMPLFPTDEAVAEPTEEATPAAAKLGLRVRPTAGAIRGAYDVVTTADELDALVSELSLSNGFAIDLETTSKDAMKADLVGFSFATQPGSAWYVPVGHEAADGQLPIRQVIGRLRPVLEGETVAKYAHNAKYDMTVLRHYGVRLDGLTFDTMLASYVLESGQRAHNLKDLAWARLGVEMTPITDLIGKGKAQITMAEVPVSQAAAYAGADADMTLRLARLLEPELRQDQLWHLFADVEMPLVPVLADMEIAGVAVDVDYLLSMSRDFRRRLDELEQQIWKAAGHRFNINSTQQLGAILFEELRLPAAKRTKTGYSTDVEVMEGLRGAHPIIQMILDYRQISKLKSTYVDALPQLVNPRTGRVHTSFNQTGTETGRLSSSEPNLQNIPTRTELGRDVRRAFITGRPHTLLLAADYSQIELRILAHITHDPKLVEAFQADEDIHSATASEIFAVPMDTVTPEMRRFAKTVNFGIIYGMSDYGLSSRAGLSRQEASEYIARYRQKYPRVWEYLEQTKRQAAEHGFVSTLLGRRRRLPEINSPNRQVKMAAERMAINMPIQGTAADIIKLAMIRLHRKLRELSSSSQLILQVHDELVLEVPEAEIEDVKALVRETMESAMPMSVPLKVGIEAGQNWRDLRPI